MPSEYNTLAARGPKEAIDYWYPGSNSAPANAAGREFEVRGLTVVDFPFGEFKLNNGDIAVFNSAGTLVEILGDNAGGGLSAFTEFWTPTFLPGVDIAFNEDLQPAFAGPGAVSGGTLSPDNKSITLSVSGGSSSDTVEDIAVRGTNDFIPANNDNNGMCFTFSDPVLMGAATMFSYLGFVDNEPFNVMTSSALIVSISRSPNQDYFNIVGIGKINFVSDPSDWTDLSGEDGGGSPIPVLWNANAEYTIAYDADAGLYGTLSFYSSINGAPATPLVTHVFTAPAIVPSSLMDYHYISTQSAGTSTATATLVGTPNNPIPGVVYHGGGEFDPTSIPADVAGTARTIEGLDNPKNVPGFGELRNGDLVFWNADGEPQGRPWTRDDVSNVAIIEAALLDSVGRVGITKLTVPFVMEQVPAVRVLGDNPVGVDATNYEYSSFIGGRDIYDQYQGNSGQWTLEIFHTPHLFGNLPTTEKGFLFKMPPIYSDWNGSGGTLTGLQYLYEAIGAPTFRLGFNTDLGTQINGHGLEKLFILVDLNTEEYGGGNSYATPTFTNPRFYITGVTGGGPDSENTFPITGVPINDQDIYRLSTDGTFLKLTNVSGGGQSAQQSLSGTTFSSELKRFIVALDGYGQYQYSQSTRVVAKIESDQTSFGNIFIGESQATNLIDIDLMPQDRANRSYEVINGFSGSGSYGGQYGNMRYPAWDDDGYGGYGSTNPTRIRKNDIIVFNSESDLVSVMSKYDLPPYY